MLIFTGAAGGSQVEFPPAEGPYSGDYVYITEPGRYTLEHPVSHTYPVGVIIAASSVILDGQGYTIEPASSETVRSVGIWIRLTDGAGIPVTGVSIRNVSITNESYGVYAEGADTSGFAWGSDRSRDPGVANAVSSPRSMILTDITLTRCGEGITLVHHPDLMISDLNIEGVSGSGIVMADSTARILRSLISGSGKDGIEVHGGSGSEISSCTINKSGDAGISLDKVSDLRIYNNILDNHLNIRAGSDSRGVVLQTAREERENIIGGRILGGNYWISDNPALPGSDTIPDADGDGIGDVPYNPGIGSTDSLPLVRTRTHVPEPKIVPVEPVTPEVVQVSTPVPVQTPLSFISGTHAVITGDTIPAELDHGKVYPVTLDLSNDGSDDWIAQYMIGIKAIGDSAEYGPEWMPAPKAGPVQPGRTLTVKFSLKSPPVPGVYTLKYQAAREGTGVVVQYGRPYTKTVTVR